VGSFVSAGWPSRIFAPFLKVFESKGVVACPSQTPTEYEATLVVSSQHPREVVRELSGVRAVGCFRLEPRGVRFIHDVYFDTPQRALSARHHALRLRQTGSEWRITLKGPSFSSKCAIAARSELELPWSRESLDRTMSELSVIGIAVDSTGFHADNPHATMLELGLVAVQDRTVVRAVRDVLGAGARVSRCEVVIDAVTYRFRGAEVLHHEVEIEAGDRSGTDAIEMLVSGLVSRFGSSLRPWSHGKLVTGRAVEELMKLGVLRDAIDVNQCLMPPAYDLIDAFLAKYP